jgi:hypothetical protein
MTISSGLDFQFIWHVFTDNPPSVAEGGSGVARWPDAQRRVAGYFAEGFRNWRRFVCDVVATPGMLNFCLGVRQSSQTVRDSRMYFTW